MDILTLGDSLALVLGMIGILVGIGWYRSALNGLQMIIY